MRAVIISADEFEDSELLVPYYRLLEEDIKVDVASLERGPIRGKHGYEVPANVTVREISVDDYDLLVLPGGRAPARLREDESVLAFARMFIEQRKLVAAICHGPQILVSAGVMEGRRATCYKSVAPELQAAGAVFLDQEVVVDRNLITSRHPGDLPAFNRELMRQLRRTPA